MSSKLVVGSIVIGQRVAVGAIVGGLIGTAASVWDWLNPDNPVPAGLVSYAQTAAIGIVQIWVANKYGITTIGSEK